MRAIRAARHPRKEGCAGEGKDVQVGGRVAQYSQIKMIPTQNLACYDSAGEQSRSRKKTVQYDFCDWRERVLAVWIVNH